MIYVDLKDPSLYTNCYISNTIGKLFLKDFKMVASTLLFYNGNFKVGILLHNINLQCILLVNRLTYKSQPYPCRLPGQQQRGKLRDNSLFECTLASLAITN